jgi:hypothetical protein
MRIGNGDAVRVSDVRERVQLCQRARTKLLDVIQRRPLKMVNSQ